MQALPEACLSSTLEAAILAVPVQVMMVGSKPTWFSMQLIH